MNNPDRQTPYEKAAAEALAEFTAKARKYLEEKGQPFPVHESRAAIASMTGTISIPQWEELEAAGLVKIIYEPKKAGSPNR